MDPERSGQADASTTIYPPAAAAFPLMPGSSDASNAVIRPYGYTESDCGYCKGSRSHLVNKPPSAGSKTYSLLADSLTPSLYEGFMFRGWRRSGIHLYKPCNFESCCPTLTIRLASHQFQPTKSQKKLLRRMHQLVVGEGVRIKTGEYESKKSTVGDDMLEKAVQQSGILQILEDIIDRVLLQVLPTDAMTTMQSQNAQQKKEWKSNFRIRAPSKKDRKHGRIQATCDICARISGAFKTIVRDELVDRVVRSVQEEAQFQSAAKNGSVSVVDMEAHPPCGQIRCIIQLRDQVMSTKVVSKNEQATNQSTHDDKLARWYLKTTGRPLRPHQRRITIETMTSHQSALNPEVHKLYAYYQNVVHNDPNPFLGERKNEEQDGSNEGTRAVNGVNHSTSNRDANREHEHVRSLTDPSQLDWGNAPIYFKEHIRLMLVNYLAPVPEKNRNAVLENFYSFYQFLVEAPFPFTPQQGQVQMPQKLHVMPYDERINTEAAKRHIHPGLYHQHYRLGDVLIAVGVVDILPSGLSSVYLFYHPTFSHELVALGKYAILSEIEYTRDILKCPYYYLGYYIESCQKMRYKAEYHPSELLCPRYFQWVDAQEAVKKLQRTPRHVCPLIFDGDSDDETEHDDTSRNELALHHLYMDIGAGINVTIDMLQPSGVQVVKPILDDFVSEAGPDLSVKCIVKLS
jgi:arginine-tRNA-protein transferase